MKFNTGKFTVIAIAAFALVLLGGTGFAIFQKKRQPELPEESLIDDFAESKWGADWKKRPRSLDSLVGEISTKMDFPDRLYAIAAEANISLPGKIIIHHEPGGLRATGGSSRWYPPEGFKLIYADGQPTGSLRGDPRALACLAYLVGQSNLGELHHIGMFHWDPTTPDFGHDGGYGIDLTRDSEMNALIEAAKKVSMPIGWISKNHDGDGWPIFQLRNGVKTLVGHSSIDHSSHFHVVLPRPQWAQTFAVRDY